MRSLNRGGVNISRGGGCPSTGIVYGPLSPLPMPTRMSELACFSYPNLLCVEYIAMAEHPVQYRLRRWANGIGGGGRQEHRRRPCCALRAPRRLDWIVGWESLEAGSLPANRWGALLALRLCPPLLCYFSYTSSSSPPLLFFPSFPQQPTACPPQFLLIYNISSSTFASRVSTTPLKEHYSKIVSL